MIKFNRINEIDTDSSHQQNVIIDTYVNPNDVSFFERTEDNHTLMVMKHNGYGLKIQESPEEVYVKILRNKKDMQ